MRLATATCLCCLTLHVTPTQDAVIKFISNFPGYPSTIFVTYRAQYECSHSLHPVTLLASLVCTFALGHLFLHLDCLVIFNHF